MILLWNVLITPHRLVGYNRPSRFRNYDRADVFIYSLYSLLPLKKFISKAIFFVDIANEFAHRKDEIYSVINQLYPDAELHHSRNYYSRDWKNNLDKIIEPGTDPKTPILICCNDDHIFMDYNTDVIESGLKLLENESNEFSCLYYSHFAEQCRWSHHQKGELTEDKNWVKYKYSNFDSIQIVTQARFREYWKFDYSQTPMYRTDSLTGKNPPMDSNMYCPTRRQFDHYDGYSHLNWNMPNDLKVNLENVIPPLVIPPKFFEGKMKIRYGFKDRDEDCVNIDPTNPNLYAAYEDGTDYRWVLNDIPLFWRDRISEITINPELDLTTATAARNQHFIATTQVPMNCWGVKFDNKDFPSLEWYTKHLRQ